MKQLTFDEVFLLWMENEIGQEKRRDVLPVAKERGFGSIVEWRLNTALKLGLDKKEWTLETIDNPNQTLPKIIIGPYQGWLKFFEKNLTTTFAKAVENDEFFKWCQTHDRIIPISENFPLPTTVILFRKENGDLIHIEGGHRICAVAYKQKIGEPIDFEGRPEVKAAIAEIKDDEINKLVEFLKQGTNK